MIEAARRQRILKKVESTLSRLISQRQSEPKIVAAVEKVRSAKLSLFKGQREIARYKETLNLSESAHLRNLDNREKEWRSKPIEEIIILYKSRD